LFDMEQHPVPQNVTTFQFRLIGDMTLKQFGYLAGGAILGYIFYKIPFPLYLNWLLGVTFLLGGFGFAFMPIEERPMDVWVLSFFKSIYSPTQYVWSRKPAVAAPSAAIKSVPVAGPPVQTQPPPKLPVAGTRGDIIQNIFVPNAPAVRPPGTASKPINKSGMFDWIFDMFTPRPHPVSSVPAHILTPGHPQMTRITSTLPAKMDLTPPPSVRGRPVAEVQPAAQPQVFEMQKKLDDLQAQRDKMEAEIARLRVQNAPLPPKPTGTYVATPATKQGASVRIITPDRAVKVGLPRLTTFPNIVTGIVKDGDQNLLPGVLITVKDKEGVPLRALKTNRLGQFAASTPLPNGTYFIEIEDPRLRYTFDRAQITLNGTIVPALEIFAKSQKEITRARLEKELFGDKTQ
jgi:hypothetical protein